jgi:hypothetical protein
MSDAKPKRRWFIFSIRDLLLVTVVAALTIGWWLDHRALNAKLRKEYDFELEQQLKLNDIRHDLYVLSAKELAKHLNDPKSELRPAAQWMARHGQLP